MTINMNRNSINDIQYSQWHHALSNVQHRWRRVLAKPNRLISA